MALNKQELSKMRASCALAANALLLAGDIITKGISTFEIDARIHAFIINAGAYPSPLHYQGFPRASCISRNNIMCHGIPNKNEILSSGDIVNVDITTYFPAINGFHGDTSATFFIGNPTKDARLIVETAYGCLCAGIEAVKPGNTIGDIGNKIVSFANKNNCSIAPEFVGHGIGKEFHSLPHVFHHGKKNTGVRIEEGMIFTIEPIVNLGSCRYKTLVDGWTVATEDGSLSAQFEHTILVTKSGYEILTKRNRRLKNSLE